MKEYLDAISEPLLLGQHDSDCHRHVSGADSFNHEMPQPQLRGLRRHTRSLLVTIYYFLLHVSVMTLLFALLLRHGEPSRAMEYSTVSPAHKAIAHEITSTWPHERNHHAEYSGPPSLANNRAWDELTRPIFFNVSKEEIVAAGESVEDSVQLEDGSYLASTRVFHDVHCLRQIRLFIYKDTYYPNVTESQERYLLGHIDHCIEALRLSVMCTGDVSLYTFFWHDPPREKPGTKTNAQRSCIVWEKFYDWSIARMIPKDANVTRPDSGGKDVIQ